MFEKKVKKEKNHDLSLQPRTCSHPINAHPTSQIIFLFGGSFCEQQLVLGKRSNTAK